MNTIVVTGAAGMIGTAVLNEFSKEKDFHIVALSRSDVNKSKDTGIISWEKTNYSKEDLERLMDGASAVIHLAGVKGDKAKLSEFDEDILMTKNVLMAMESQRVHRMIYASSRLVYANPNTVPWTEDTPPMPVSAYGINKLRTEKLCCSHCERKGLQITAVRIAQVINESDQFNNMINVFRDLSIAKKPLSVIGKSVAKRQYLYANDLAEIFRHLLFTELDGFMVVNAGMLQSYTNLEIAEAFCRAYHNDSPINYDDSMSETITESIMDVSRMIDMTGFIPMDMNHVLEEMARKTSKV